MICNWGSNRTHSLAWSEQINWGRAEKFWFPKKRLGIQYKGSPKDAASLLGRWILATELVQESIGHLSRIHLLLLLGNERGEVRAACLDPCQKSQKKLEEIQLDPLGTQGALFQFGNPKIPEREKPQGMYLGQRGSHPWTHEAKRAVGSTFFPEGEDEDADGAKRRRLWCETKTEETFERVSFARKASFRRLFSQPKVRGLGSMGGISSAATSNFRAVKSFTDLLWFSLFFSKPALFWARCAALRPLRPLTRGTETTWENEKKWPAHASPHRFGTRPSRKYTNDFYWQCFQEKLPSLVMTGRLKREAVIPFFLQAVGDNVVLGSFPFLPGSSRLPRKAEKRGPGRNISLVSSPKKEKKEKPGSSLTYPDESVRCLREEGSVYGIFQKRKRCNPGGTGESRAASWEKTHGCFFFWEAFHHLQMGEVATGLSSARPRRWHGQRESTPNEGQEAFSPGDVEDPLHWLLCGYGSESPGVWGRLPLPFQGRAWTAWLDHEISPGRREEVDTFFRYQSIVTAVRVWRESCPVGMGVMWPGADRKEEKRPKMKNKKKKRTKKNKCEPNHLVKPMKSGSPSFFFFSSEVVVWDASEIPSFFLYLFYFIFC